MHSLTPRPAGSSAADPAAVAPVVATALSGRRRRPSGEPPPLPRAVPRSTFWYSIAVATLVPLECLLAWPLGRRAVTDTDAAVLRAVALARSDATDAVARALQVLGSPLTVRLVGWATIGVLLVARRFRHLVVDLALLLAVALASGYLALAQGRMRPTAVALLGHWSGYAHPSAPVATAAVGVGVCRTCLPAGVARRRGTQVVAVLIGLLVLARLLLGVDAPSDAAAALALGWALPVVVFRLVCPDDAFPVSYRRRAPAHLDVGGRRGAAIRTAVAQQLGLTLDDVVPFGDAGSAGSTPLRLEGRTDDGRPIALFGKLCALSHLRADRSYKTARMVLYGRLEDEKPFNTVRRLVEYEDHMLRLLRDAGVPVPAPAGLVEITPEREYMVVMALVDGAEEIGRTPLTPAQIDGALTIVRRLWEAGVAHRDIKPSNVLVHGDEVVLIDVAFATVRPTPWRQAVDLANMMLTLALAADPEVVHTRALRLFAAEDVAEAFAATRSVTLPTQLRTRLRSDPRDLVATFRALAPGRAPVAIQVWTPRRVAAAALVAVAAAAALVGLAAYTRLAGLS